MKNKNLIIFLSLGLGGLFLYKKYLSPKPVIRIDSFDAVEPKIVGMAGF